MTLGQEFGAYAVMIGSASAQPVRAPADPTAGWTSVPWNASSYNVQNWTKAPLNQRFTITSGVYNINVHSGERCVEMAWDRWTNQNAEHLWSADVLLDSGGTKTAIMQVKIHDYRGQGQFRQLCLSLCF